MPCPSCGTGEPEFVEFEQCASCLGLEVWSEDEAQQWRTKACQELMEKARQKFAARPKGFGEAFLGVINDMFLDQGSSSVRTWPQAWALLEILRVAYREPNEAERQELQEGVEGLGQLALELEKLRELKFGLAQGRYRLVEGVPEGHSVTRYSFGPPYPVTLRDQEWKLWTQISFGAGPRLEEMEPGFLEALERDDPDATLLDLAVQMDDVSTLALKNQMERQMFNRFAPDIINALEQLSKVDQDYIIGISTVLDALAETPRGPPRVPRADGTAAGVDKLVLMEFASSRDVQFAIPLLKVSEGGTPVAPVLLESGSEYLFPPQMVRHLGHIITNYHSLEDGRRMSDLAGEGFERVVRQVLDRADYVTEHDDVPLLNLSTAKGGSHEIDVVAWNEEEMLFVEARARIDNPGAWSPDRMDKRREKLVEWKKRLAQKLEGWRQTLQEPRPAVRDPDDRVVELPSNLLDERHARGLIVSIRVEPRPSDVVGDASVVTFMPPLAAEVARRRLPQGDLSEIWSGRGPVPQ